MTRSAIVCSFYRAHRAYHASRVFRSDRHSNRVTTNDNTDDNYRDAEWRKVSGAKEKTEEKKKRKREQGRGRNSDPAKPQRRASDVAGQGEEGGGCMDEGARQS